MMKKLLRSVYYFFSDLGDWYTSSKRLPSFMRNRLSLVVIMLVVTVSLGGLVACMGEPRTLPAEDASVSEPESESEPASESEPESESESEPEPESEPAIDAMASATRFTPVTAEQLSTTLKDRTAAYYKNAAANGVIFNPPAAGDIAAWKAVNPDTIGWIKIPNTNINYAVLKGAYTDYYTHRGYQKEQSRNGVIWVDTDTKLAANGSIASQNTVIYGHNWTNCWRPVHIGSPSDIMFGQLHAYDDAAFAAANPIIHLATPDGDHTYQIFSVFYARPTEFSYNYADGSRVPGIITKAKGMSIHPFNVPVSSTDKVITLSTCTRVMGAGDNQRFVVMAKKIS